MNTLELIKSDTTKAFETIIIDNNSRDLAPDQRENLFRALEKIVSVLTPYRVFYSDKELFDKLRVLGQEIVILYPGASADHYSAIIKALKDNATDEEGSILVRIERCLENPVAQARLACLQIAIGDVQAEPESAEFFTNTIRMKKLDPQKIGVIFFNAFAKGNDDEVKKEMLSEAIEVKVKNRVEALTAIELTTKRLAMKGLSAAELAAIQLDAEELATIEKEAREFVTIQVKQEALRASPAYRKNVNLYKSLAVKTDSNEDAFLRQSIYAENELILKANLKILEKKVAKLKLLMSQVSLQNEAADSLREIIFISEVLLSADNPLSEEEKNERLIVQSEQLDIEIRRLQEIEPAVLVESTSEQDDDLVEINEEEPRDADHGLRLRAVYQDNLRKVKERLSVHEAPQSLVQELDSIDSEITALDPSMPESKTVYREASSQLEMILLDPAINMQDSEHLKDHDKGRYGIFSGLLNRVTSVVNNIIEFMREWRTSKPKEKASESSNDILLNVAASTEAASTKQKEHLCVGSDSPMLCRQPIQRTIISEQINTKPGRTV